jgi:hypothetical protein
MRRSAFRILSLAAGIVVAFGLALAPVAASGGSVNPNEYTSRGERRKAGRWPRDSHSGHTPPTPGRMTRLMMDAMNMLLLVVRRVR